MPRTLTEKVRRTANRAIRLKTKGQKHCPILFQGAPVKAAQEIAEEIK